MNKYFKGAIIFGTGVIGGFGLCGGFVIRKILMTHDLREFLAKKISKKFFNSTYGKSNYYEYTNAFIIFESRNEAEKVLNAMEELIEKYGAVTVSDVHELCNTNSTYTDNKYGWTNLGGTRVNRVRAGYRLSLPIALQL